MSGACEGARDGVYHNVSRVEVRLVLAPSLRQLVALLRLRLPPPQLRQASPLQHLRCVAVACATALWRRAVAVAQAELGLVRDGGADDEHSHITEHHHVFTFRATDSPHDEVTDEHEA
eukprot:scaffold38931_cov66-Phaeocystis_antarctica.AAC.2